MFRAMLICAAVAAATPALAQERLPPVKPEAYDAEQRQAAEAFRAARGRDVFGPFAMLIRSPDVMTAARSMGDYLRYGSAIGTTLSELVILVVAREWSQDYEWGVHAPIALQQGISRATVDAIADGRRPAAMSEDEAICYDFTVELMRNKRVSDPTYERALKRFGEKGVVDLAAIGGYYSFLAMTMNTARTPGVPGQPPLKRFPE